MAATADGGGYWEVAADGGIFAFGDATFYGSMGGQPLDAAHRGHGRHRRRGRLLGGGLRRRDLRLRRRHASTAPWAASRSNAPIVGIAATADGGGYWEVASDGGIFAFGDATFYGSMGGQPLERTHRGPGRHRRRGRLLGGGL